MVMFWRRISQGVGQDSQLASAYQQPRATPLREVINDPAKHLFHLMMMDETHALVFGSIGTGKTTLVKNALMNVPSNYAVIVFDVAGAYEGFTDYHAPYPFNPLGLLSDVETLDVLGEVLTMRFPRLNYVMTPAMEHMFMTAYAELTGKAQETVSQGSDEEDQQGVKISISDVIKHLDEAVRNGSIAREDEVNSARGLMRRLRYFDHWVFRTTHPLINRLFSNELRGRSIGIDLSWLAPIQRWFYVLSFLASLNVVDVRNLTVVIDEAHLYFRLGESTLTTSVRIGRNYNRYFILITQSVFDIPEEFISMNKLFIEFPTMFYRPENIIFREPGFRAFFGRNEFYDTTKTAGIMPPHWSPLTALMHLHITNKALLQMTSEGKPYLELRVEVNPTMNPKPNATMLRKCAETYGIELGVIKELGFTNKKLQDRLSGVWECIGKP